MIDSGASTIIMPKQIAKVLNIKYDPFNKGVMLLDGNRVQTIGLIKNLPLTLFACPSVTVSQEVMVIDIPPVFGLYLSRYFTTKIGGYMSLDWSHLILRTQHVAKLKILSEPLHAKHIAHQALINFEPTHTSISNDERKVVEILEDEEVMGEILPEQEAFLNEFINSDPFSNYHPLAWVPIAFLKKIKSSQSLLRIRSLKRSCLRHYEPYTLMVPNARWALEREFVSLPL